MIGWAIVVALFFFLCNQLRVSLAVCLVSLSCWNVHHPGRWWQILIKNVSVHFSIHPSFNYMKFASIVCWKTAPHHDVPTSKLHCWYGVFWVMCCAIWPLNMVCTVWHPKSSILVSSDQTIFSQYFTDLSKSKCFSFSNWVLPGDRAYRPWWLSALLIVFFESIIPANSRSFWRSPQIVLGS